MFLLHLPSISCLNPKNNDKFSPPRVLEMVLIAGEAEPTPSASLEEIRELFRWKLNNNSARKERRIQMDEKGKSHTKMMRPQLRTRTLNPIGQSGMSPQQRAQRAQRMPQ